jgi:hypothetical protein
MSLLCVICTRHGRQRRASDGYMTCTPCADTLRERLQGIAKDYPRLLDPHTLIPVRNPGSGAVAAGPRDPAQVDLIVLTDRRTKAWSHSDPTNPLVVCESWARMVREDRGEEPPEGRATIASETGLLIRRLDWVTRRDWVDQFDHGVAAAHHTLQRVLRELAAVVRIGECPAIAEGAKRPCGKGLRVRVGDDVIRCTSCDAKWARGEWQLLGRVLGGPKLDYAALSAWLGVPVGTLRRWRSEDQWQQYGEPQRPVWSMETAWNSHERRRTVAA